MTPIIAFACTFSLGCVGLALLLIGIRLMKGPAAQDRIMALDNLYITSMLLLLLLGIRHDSVSNLNAALIIGLIGFASSMALGKFILRGEVIE